MANVTISINDELLTKAREYAKLHNTSLNNLIRQILVKTINYKSKKWLVESFQLMDKAGLNTKGVKWKREDLYDV